MFYEAFLDLEQPGNWQIEIIVDSTDGVGQASFEAVVERESNINWYLIGGAAVIVIAAAIFVMRSRPEGKRCLRQARLAGQQTLPAAHQPALVVGDADRPGGLCCPALAWFLAVGPPGVAAWPQCRDRGPDGSSAAGPDAGTLPRLNSPPSRYRQVTATGHYDLEGQFVLLQQNYNGQAGVYLFAPLLLAGEDRALLVNRGWLPADQTEPADWSRYDVGDAGHHHWFYAGQPETASGQYAQITLTASPIRRRPGIGPLWRRFSSNIRMSFCLAICSLSRATRRQRHLPYPVAAEVDLSEGNHQSYAYQWFAFALTLAIVYLFLVRRQESVGCVTPV